MTDIRSLIRSRAALSAEEVPQQVLFYSADYEPFAVTWQTGAADGRWAFRFSMDADVTFINYVLEIMQDTGRPANHLLIATKGGGAWFYGAPDSAPRNDKTTIGLIPNVRQPAKFANSVSTFAPGAPFTLLGDSGAGNTAIDGTTYIGVDMMSVIAVILAKPMLASDQPVVRLRDGVATTVGNIWQATADGDCHIKYPAPGAGHSQPFPLSIPA